LRAGRPDRAQSHEKREVRSFLTAGTQGTIRPRGAAAERRIERPMQKLRSRACLALPWLRHMAIRNWRAPKTWSAPAGRRELLTDFTTGPQRRLIAIKVMRVPGNPLIKGTFLVGRCQPHAGCTPRLITSHPQLSTRKRATDRFPVWSRVNRANPRSALARKSAARLENM
jgi:hypothetical protein